MLFERRTLQKLLSLMLQTCKPTSFLGLLYYSGVNTSRLPYNFSVVPWPVEYFRVWSEWSTPVAFGLNSKYLRRLNKLSGYKTVELILTKKKVLSFDTRRVQKISDGDGSVASGVDNAVRKRRRKFCSDEERAEAKRRRDAEYRERQRLKKLSDDFGAKFENSDQNFETARKDETGCSNVDKSDDDDNSSK